MAGVGGYHSSTAHLGLSDPLSFQAMGVGGRERDLCPFQVWTRGELSLCKCIERLEGKWGRGQE